MNYYGPAALFGVIIGAAILLDDLLASEQQQSSKTPDTAGINVSRATVESNELSENISEPVRPIGQVAPSPRPSTLASRPSGAPTTVEASLTGREAPEIALAIRTIIEKARAEGRQPDPKELEAAVRATQQGERFRARAEMGIAGEPMIP